MTLEMLNGITPHFYPAGDEAELIREKVEQCVLMMVVGMVSLGGSLGVVLMYIAYMSFSAGDNQSPSFQRSNENLSARSLVWPWPIPPKRRCLEPVIRLPAAGNCTLPASKKHRAASRPLWFYDPLRHRCQRWTGVCVFRAFRTFEDCFKRCLAP